MLSLPPFRGPRKSSELATIGWVTSVTRKKRLQVSVVTGGCSNHVDVIMRCHGGFESGLAGTAGQTTADRADGALCSVGSVASAGDRGGVRLTMPAAAPRQVA